MESVRVRGSCFAETGVSRGKVQLVGTHPILWHNGMVGGSASYLGIVPEFEIGAVVLTNTSRSVDAVGVKILSEVLKIERARTKSLQTLKKPSVRCVFEHGFGAMLANCCTLDIPRAGDQDFDSGLRTLAEM